eukprot:scaffold4051_cov68-Phaeocystis_antarctica.AAC.1
MKIRFGGVSCGVWLCVVTQEVVRLLLRPILYDMISTPSPSTPYTRFPMTTRAGATRALSVGSRDECMYVKCDTVNCVRSRNLHPCFRPWASAQLKNLQQLLRLRGSVLEPPSEDELVALLLEVSLVFDRGNQLSGLEVEHPQERAVPERFEAARDL